MSAEFRKRTCFSIQGGRWSRKVPNVNPRPPQAYIHTCGCSLTHICTHTQVNTTHTHTHNYSTHTYTYKIINRQRNEFHCIEWLFSAHSQNFAFLWWYLTKILFPWSSLYRNCAFQLPLLSSVAILGWLSSCWAFVKTDKIVHTSVYVPWFTGYLDISTMIHGNRADERIVFLCLLSHHFSVICFLTVVGSGKNTHIHRIQWLKWIQMLPHFYKR